MAESLRRLVNIATFSILQEKLERWLDDYRINTCDQNVARCCEIIELNARVQAQLFKLASLTSAEGGVYGGASIIKSRLLPWLGQGLYAGSPLITDATLGVLADSVEKEREINDLQENYERNLSNLEQDLNSSKIEADDLKHELDLTKDELEATKRASANDKMFTESEVRELRAKLRVAEDEVTGLRTRTGMIDSYERQIRRLREDIAVLSGRKDFLINGETSVPLPVPIIPTKSSTINLPRPTSPFIFDDVTQRVRQQNLITRFNDMFVQDRLDAMDILRRYSDDHDNNQRIVFAVLQEAFTAAKLAFANFKMKVRSNLAITHVGPETLEEEVQNYINRNTDLYDLSALVSDVMRALNRSPRLRFPPESSYSIIQPFIREACKLAWNMSALAHPIDITVASEGELFEDSKYRRSYDADYSAPLVSHHIWPALQQGLKTIMKGEAVTRRGAGLSRSRSPGRSLSPTRSLSPSRARSRSPSPRRYTGLSTPDRARSPSRASSRAVTASTALSHYGVRG